MLYKYFYFDENSLAMLVNKELWASHPTRFNDPFDSAFSVTNEHVERYKQQKAICCFSEDHANILMWSHYSDKHTGFCVGFDKEKFQEEGLLEQVTYTEIFPPFLIENLVSKESNNVRPNERVKLFTTKFTDWQYEKEWRLIYENDPENFTNDKVNGKLVKIPDNSIVGVYFGCKMPVENQITIRNILKDCNVSFKNMEMSKVGFALIET